MTDIVERLRVLQTTLLAGTSEDWVAKEAADEIERLRAVLEKITTLRHSNNSAAAIAQSALDTMKALKDECT